MVKYIFFTGGVLSGTGKGIAASALAALLKASNIRVNIIKLDPYLNTNAGLMSPLEHGEVFVTKDGTETDMDLGHYERFLNQYMSKNNNITSGTIYKSIFKKEKKGFYLGKTIQIFPHAIEEIIFFINKAIKPRAQVAIIEVGGTIGDLEATPFYEAIRRIMLIEKGIIIHVAPIFKLNHELKTKPLQHSLQKAKSLGINPNFVVCRSITAVSDKEKRKIEFVCGIKQKNIFSSYDTEIYNLPLVFYEQKFDQAVKQSLLIKENNIDIKPWKKINKGFKNLPKVNIGIINKYDLSGESYKSLVESIRYSGLSIDIDPVINFISTQLKKEEFIEKISEMQGIIIPGSFGRRAVDKNLIACSTCREFLKPCLGICMGFQSMIIEFANSKGIQATSEEFENKNCIIKKADKMWIGEKKIEIKEHTILHKAYEKTRIKERFRNRYIWCKSYEYLLNKELMESAKHKDQLVAIELVNHPFYVGVQYHPEFTSRPMYPNPLVKQFLRHIFKNKL